MKNRITRNRYVLVLVVVALTAFIQLGTGWLQTVETHAQDPSPKVLRYSLSRVLGLASGQSLRISLGAAGSRGDLVWSYALCDSSNQTLFESELITVPLGEWRHSTVSREALNIEGEPGTGRAQVLLQIVAVVPRGVKSSDFIGSLEILDEDGRTASSDVLDAMFDFGPLPPK